MLPISKLPNLHLQDNAFDTSPRIVKRGQVDSSSPSDGTHRVRRCSQKGRWYRGRSRARMSKIIPQHWRLVAARAPRRLFAALTAGREPARGQRASHGRHGGWLRRCRRENRRAGVLERNGREGPREQTYQGDTHGISLHKEIVFGDIRTMKDKRERS